ncbi:MAG: NepR family anti-sigma factor [Aurantimonas endophytica]|jgi:hypothetical protein|uniref:Anti-sigma factor NepR domain-containing protein n=1 Tax=Aurantimonas endophytica TaxID=1522175 RepID=A0A7W6MNZ8_9HYPH|nr:NepR family anti-sigma factor [Aurantimonas endophytica]MBB4002460.1 hypothetical protein [Aurantimonas endophytica]
MDDRDTKDPMFQEKQHQRSPTPTPQFGVQTAIGKRLKAYYDDVASEPVPDRFLSLLDALDAAESASKNADRK